MQTQLVFTTAEKLKANLQPGDIVDVFMGFTSQMTALKYPKLWNDFTLNGSMQAIGTVEEIAEMQFEHSLGGTNAFTVVKVDDGENTIPVVDPECAGDFMATIVERRPYNLRPRRQRT